MIGLDALDWVLLVLAFQIYSTVYVLAIAVACRAIHADVEVVSFGFGPTLLKFRRHGILYKVGCIPMGGYAAVPALDPTHATAGNGPAGASGRLIASQKVLLSSVGPLSNIVLGFLVLSASWWAGRMEPRFLRDAPVIGWCRPESALDRAGLRRGDLVLAMDYGGSASKTETWRDLIDRLSWASGRNLRVECHRGTNEVTIRAEAGSSLYLDVSHAQPAAMGTVEHGSPASLLGFRGGDLIVEVDGTHVTHWLELGPELCLRDDHEDSTEAVSTDAVHVVVDRSGQRLPLAVPRSSMKKDLRSFGLRPPIWPVSSERKSIVEGLVQAGIESLDVLHLAGDTFRAMVSSSASRSRNPVQSNGYRQLVLCRFTTGSSGLVTAAGMIGIVLGLLNLLPIPIFPGGHILLACVEVITGHPPNPRFVNVMVNIFAAAWMVFLVFLAIKGCRALVFR